MSYQNNLTTYYRKHGVSCLNFNCKQLESCQKFANNRPFAKGAEAHIGDFYGQITRIVVLSLDAAGGCSTIEDRTEIIQGVKYEKTNKHMKGTIELLSDLLSPYGVDKVSVLKHFAMTNAAKCSGNDGNSDKLPDKVYSNCREIHIGEIEVLRPEVIFAEGKDAIPDYKLLENINDGRVKAFASMSGDNAAILNSICNTINRYVKIFKTNSCESYLVKCPHPSSRQGQWEVFREISMPVINEFLRFELGLTSRCS